MKQLNQNLNLWELADAVGLTPTADSWIQYGEYRDGQTEEIEMPLMHNENSIKFAVNPETRQAHQLRGELADGYRLSGYETRSSISAKFHLIRPGSQVRVPHEGRWGIGTLIDAQRDADGKVRVQIGKTEKEISSAVVRPCDPKRPERMIRNLLADAHKREFSWQEKRDSRLADEIQEGINEGAAAAQEACDRVEQELSRI